MTGFANIYRLFCSFQDAEEQNRGGEKLATGSSNITNEAKAAANKLTKGCVWPAGRVFDIVRYH